MFCRRSAKGFVSDQGEIVAAREFIEPIVHRIDDCTHPESFIAQHVADTFLLKVNWSIGIAPRYLQIQRNETIARVPHQQNDLCPAKLRSRHEIFASQSIPETAFGPVFEQIVRKYQAGNTRVAITFRPESEFKAEALAEIGANERAEPGASTFRDRNDNCVPTRQFGRTTAEIAAGPSQSRPPKSEPRNGFICRRKPRKPSRQALLESGGAFRLGPGQRFRCDFDCHSGRSRNTQAV